ncbi:prepilin-type N-terminal cleavage/methylation domain-containing protein [Cryobacterium algoritolerans]|uniref:Prepilin-type N-terminal cleavage/methylation domain-containing protein n=1 Tax=Cryobacterium algoritolerans TaxID=1259184 RepID=A0A4R8WT06_9MICO|nr:prepilin-type N-terminal cleavage/methylation domain-containing protein [Cryobacterium algoritolerans]
MPTNRRALRLLGRPNVKLIRVRTFRSDTRDLGFSLIEIMVAMMLLAVLALAVLPTLVTGLRTAATNTTLATSTGLVNQQLEDARSRTTCGALAAPPFSATDTRGAVLTVTRSVASCPVGGYPRAISVSISVTRAATGVTVSSARTLVYVEGP